MNEDVQIRAARAQQLLEDEVLVEALNGITKDALYRAGTASLASSSECIAAIAYLQATADIHNKLNEFITAGKAAERKPYKVA
jgi:hypothetical protein